MEFLLSPVVFLCLPGGGKQAAVCIRCDLYFIDFSICQLARQPSLSLLFLISPSLLHTVRALCLASGFRMTASEAQNGRNIGETICYIEGGREGDAV